MKAIWLLSCLLPMGTESPDPIVEDEVAIVEFHHQIGTDAFPSVYRLVFWQRFSNGNSIQPIRVDWRPWGDRPPRPTYSHQRQQWYLLIEDYQILYCDENGIEIGRYYPRRIWFREFWFTQVPYLIEAVDWINEFHPNQQHKLKTPVLPQYNYNYNPHYEED